MQYPKFLKENKSVIGVTAPSAGITDKLKIHNFKFAKEKLEQLYGFKTIFTDNVFSSIDDDRSSTAFQRGEEFNELVRNKDVDLIVSATGGNYLCEMLEYVDLELFKKNPKFVQGYSDNTSLLYILTTFCDVATIYNQNFSYFGMDDYSKPQYDSLNLLLGKQTKFESNLKYQSNFQTAVTGTENYALDADVKYTSFNCKDEKVKIKGRLIGGCSDIIFGLCGTKYDNTVNFCEKYKEDGIIFYLETFASSDVDLYIHLWQLKNADYFKYCKGIIFGRETFYNSFSNQTYKDVCISALKDLNIPLIFDADIGHRPPVVPIVNGAVCTIDYKDHKCTFEYEFK